MGCGASAKKVPAKTYEVQRYANPRAGGVAQAREPHVASFPQQSRVPEQRTYRSPAVQDVGYSGHPASTVVAACRDEHGNNSKQHDNQAPSGIGEWRFEESPGVWRPLNQAVGQQLLQSYYAGEARSVYTRRGVSYEVVYAYCIQTNRTTGEQQQICWVAGSSPNLLDGDFPGAANAQTRYQWQLKNGAWVDYDDDEQVYFTKAWMGGQNVVRYQAFGFLYEINFEWMQQSNLETGQVRQMRIGRAQGEQTNGIKNIYLGASGTTPATAAGCKQGTKFSLNPGQAASGHVPVADIGDGGTVPLASDIPEGLDPVPVLPDGVYWPALPEALWDAETLFSDLVAAQSGQLDARRGVYKSACLQWHPDKNIDNEDVATEIFQFLQALRTWYFEPPPPSGVPS